MTSFAKLATGLCAVSLVMAGCNCSKGGGPVGSRGAIRVIYSEGGAQLAASPDDDKLATFDFGQVPMGKTVSQKLTVQNTGTGVLTITDFTHPATAGDAPVGFVRSAGTTGDPNPVFDLAFDSVDIPTGETHDFDLSFMPPTDPVAKQVDHLSTVVLTAANTQPGQDTQKLVFKGSAVSGECELPKVIDFGAVARGDTFKVPVTIKNTRPIDSVANVGDIQSAQGDTVFTFTPDSPRGSITITPNHEKIVTFAFAPTEARDYFATVSMTAADGCPEVRVRLIGTGVDQVLTWDPPTVEFGYVTPGLTVSSTITFSNQGFKDVAASSLNAVDLNSTSTSTIFKVTMASPNDLTKLTVPAGSRYNNPADPNDPQNGKIVPGKATLTMSFKPTVLGPKNGTLGVATDLSNLAHLSIPLHGFGGGPDIDVRPAPVLDMGRVAFFANQNSFATRKLTISNVGTHPTPPDPRANLKLGDHGTGAPFWTVTANNATTLTSELCVGTFDTTTSTCTGTVPTTTYDPAIGIEASGARANIDIPIRVTPTGIGQREWTVTILSNDPDEPTFTVIVKANVVLLPPCLYTVTPLNLNFGVVTPPSTRDLSFTIRNNSSNAGDVCLVSGLDMKPGSDPMFSLPAGAIAEQELQPGDTMSVLVRAWPTGTLPANPTAVLGQVLFNISNPSNPQGQVNLQATLAPSCLTIAPNDLDFGTVQKDCNSPDRTFQVYNTCTTPITIQQVQMIAAAGEPAGGPNCTGTSPCPEFFTVSTGSIAPGTVVQPGGTSTPLSFALKYHPINYGADTGAFLIKVTQAGQTVDYVVTLRGNGDTMGMNTDTFRQDTKPKADILLVVDDSCSMASHQQSLANNLPSFLQYAIASQVDFQIGVTNTELSDSTHGSLYTSPGGYKILRPTTPNLLAEYAGLVDVGINGGSEGCLEPATLALTAPYITDPNKNLGFLRQDAVLAVVCVTDAEDQSAQPAAFYLNQLLNIKGVQRASMFTYNVIGPFLSNPSATIDVSTGQACSYDTGSVQPDVTKHLYMVSQTNGVKEEICTPDWASALQNIGKNAFGYRTNFYLTARPDLSGTHVITVSIDGVNLDPVDSRGAPVWTYDSTSNSVNFEPLYVPEPGKTLTVTYQVSCIP